MWLIKMAMRRPVSIIVAVLTLALMSVVAASRMKVDIFPDLNVPMITVVQPYGGMDPAQMEGYLVTFYEQHFFYISGVDHITSQSIQSCAVMNIYFHPGMNMADAMAQVVAQVERSRAYMPPGTVTPFILRFDVGNVPVGFLVFSSPNRSLAEIQDLAYARVRPVVSTIPGVTTPPPFGGNQRTIVLTVDRKKLDEYHMSLADLTSALASGNLIIPSGVVRTGGIQRIATINSTVSDIQEMGRIPLSTGQGTRVYLRDLCKIEDSTDIATGYALVNGRRAVYMAISKQSAASTLSVVNGVKSNIAFMQSLLPPDIKVSFAFDQSVYVTEAIRGVLFEGGLGAILTGLAVLIFLQDVRSALIVVLNIPLALFAALVALWASGQTINIMTLGGLSLAVGILVDEATVAIENIHTHTHNNTRDKPFNVCIFEACVEVVTPRLLAMLSVVSVFMPSFFMTGSTQALFVPLSLAVGFAMIASYFLSNTFVPVMAGWLLKRDARPHASHGTSGNGDGNGTGHGHGSGSGNGSGNGNGNYNKGNNSNLRRPDLMMRIRMMYERTESKLLRSGSLVLILYATIAGMTLIIYPLLGREIFPAGNPSGFQLRLRGPSGMCFQKTEKLVKEILGDIAREVGKQNLDISIGYAGTQPPAYAVSNVYMWTSGPQEALLLVAFKEDAHIKVRELEEKLRGVFAKRYPDMNITFEAGDIVNKIMNFGAATPVQVDINGPSFAADQSYAQRLLTELKKIDYLRDVGIVQPLDFPTLDIKIDRVRAGQLGVNVRDIGRSEIAASYSSRFIEPIYWRDPKSGLAYQVEVMVPASEVRSIRDIEDIPVKTGSFSGPFVRDVGTASFGSMVGEYDHFNMRRMLSIRANLAGPDLGKALRLVNAAIARAGTVPRGVKVAVRGQAPTMVETFNALLSGVVFAILVIFLMLVGYFQSVRLASIVISVIPAIVFGAVFAIWVSGSTVNVQSFMGTIMSTGVGVANAILVIVFTEEKRLSGLSARTAAVKGAGARLRPVLMTSLAMIAGMIPMALGLGEGGERTAPLGRAVIGGLTCSTTCVLVVLPIIYALVQRHADRKPASLLHDEEALRRKQSTPAPEPKPSERPLAGTRV